MGDDAQLVAEALMRVNFAIVTRANECEAVILLPGSPDVPAELKALAVYDYRSASDYRVAISRLSQDIEL
jgi:hypothetical protein